MRTLTARPALRWLVPLALLAVLFGSVLLGTRASADPALPKRTEQQLLVDLQTAQVDGLSGTIVQNADLGIPAIPGGEDSPGGKLTSLLAGDHTMRVWLSGTDKVRIAQVDQQYAESDVIVNGRQVWTYDSQARTATHRTLSADQPAGASAKVPADAPKTPQEAAKLLLAKLGTDTRIGTDRATHVAGRQAYELVLTPKADQSGSLIKQVRVAIDGTTHIPLRVQVLGSDKKPAFEVGFADGLTIGKPADRIFTWNPPARTKVTEEKGSPAKTTAKAPTKAQRKALEQQKAEADQNTKVVGQGWTAVVITKLPAGATTSDPTVKGFLDKLKVPGGYELNGKIFTAILTDDGRLAVGAVSPELVQQALAK
jgi:outer membrane lipoprotein-sorting protein